MLVGVQSKHLQIFVWVSSEIFGKPWSSWEMFEDICVAFSSLWTESLENFGKLWKVVGNLQKIVKNNIISMLIQYNKQNIMWFLVDMEDVFSCSTVYI